MQTNKPENSVGWALAASNLNGRHVLVAMGLSLLGIWTVQGLEQAPIVAVAQEECTPEGDDTPNCDEAEVVIYGPRENRPARPPRPELPGTALAGNGGVSTAMAAGGAVSLGDVASGLNAGSVISIGDTYGNVVVGGGTSSNVTEIDVSVDAGIGVATASGGYSSLAVPD